MKLKNKPAIIGMIVCMLLMFLLIGIVALLTGGREMQDFTTTDWDIFIGFVVLEVIILVIMFILADRVGKANVKKPQEGPKTNRDKNFQLRGAGIFVVAFILAIAAIFLMNYQKGTEKAGSRMGLIAMLLACGTADAMSKIFKESGATSLEGQFLFYTFAVAMGLCAVCMTVKGQRIGLREAIFGTLIAVPNFFSSMFLLGALESLSAVIVYPVFSVGTILTVPLAGVLAFRERLERFQQRGYGISTARIRYIVAWKGREETQEVPIALPEIELSRLTAAPPEAGKEA